MKLYWEKNSFYIKLSLSAPAMLYMHPILIFSDPLLFYVLLKVFKLTPFSMHIYINIEVFLRYFLQILILMSDFFSLTFRMWRLWNKSSPFVYRISILTLSLFSCARFPDNLSTQHIRTVILAANHYVLDCLLWLCSSSIPWELVRNTGSLDSFHPKWMRNCL